MRPELRRSRALLPLAAVPRRPGGSRRRVWGWTRLTLSSGRLSLRALPLGVQILNIDRRQIIEARQLDGGTVEVRYQEVGRPWAGLVDADPEVREARAHLYLGAEAPEWARRLNR